MTKENETRRLSVAQANAVYDVLAEECKAPDDHLGDRQAFVRYFTEDTCSGSKEWRFQGKLGFGGKCRMESHKLVPYVTYYPEHRTDERDAAVKRANERLAALFSEEVSNGE